MKIRHIAFAALFAAATAFTATAGDCGPTLSTVEITDAQMFTQQGNMNVDFNVDFSKIDLGKNQQVVYTPMIVSADGTQQQAFGKIVLNGRNVAIREQRSPKTRVAGAIEEMRRYNGTQQSYRFAATTPYQPWMEQSKLVLAEDLCGCGDLQSQDKLDLAQFDNTPVPSAVLIYIEPEVEETKARSESGSAYVDFVVNTIDIRPTYRNNKVEIAKIVSTIDLVKNDPNVSITEINIHGYASPEGTYKRNTWLAENRAISLMKYVKSLYTIPDNVFTSAYTPEDWAGLRKLVVASDIAERDAILAIIDDEKMSPDDKDWKIKHDYPKTYAFMLKEWYPGLRHSDYTVNYTVRPFSVEEALAIMKVNPKQVSLNEMFMVAQTFTPGSPEYNEVMQIAVKTYPDNETANLNAAISAINSGDFAGATNYLAKVTDTAAAYNARGALALGQGDYDKAQAYFQKAADAGIAGAQDYLDLVSRARARAAMNR